jgi:DNA-binding SARP family transcriptional activator
MFLSAVRDQSRLQLLGDWHLYVAPTGQDAETAQSRKVSPYRDAKRLLALLALLGPLSRAQIRIWLWPDAADATAASRLRNAIWQLSSARRRLLDESTGALRLREDINVDVDELFTAVTQIESRLPTLDARQFEADLLPAWDEDWLLVHRERVRQLRLHALEQMSGLHLSQGRHAIALDCALAALNADPLRESAHRAVIRVHLAEDNVALARDQYARCRAVLKTELGVGPSRTLTALMREPTAPSGL